MLLKEGNDSFDKVRERDNPYFGILINPISTSKSAREAKEG